MFGYNDMNTYSPNPFVTQGSIILSGSGRMKTGAEFNKKRRDELQKELDMMDGAGFFDDVKKDTIRQNLLLNLKQVKRLKKH